MKSKTLAYVFLAVGFVIGAALVVKYFNPVHHLKSIDVEPFADPSQYVKNERRERRERFSDRVREYFSSKLPKMPKMPMEVPTYPNNARRPRDRPARPAIAGASSMDRDEKERKGFLKRVNRANARVGMKTDA